MTTAASRTPPPPSKAPRGAACGFTLVESLMSVLIVSVVLVAALGTVGAIGRSRQVQVERAAAVHLANQVMAEIVQCYYQDPSGAAALGRDAGETDRAQFNDVDDYDGWESTGTPKLRNGTSLAGYDGWKIGVAVDYADLAQPGSAGAGDTGLKRIRLRIEMPGGGTYEMSALRAAAGAYEQAPAEETTYLTYGGVSARVGERGKAIYGGAHPLNVKASQ